MDESVTISTIRFLEKVGKREYYLYRTDGKVIINTSCIKDIRRQEKGRIEINLINLPERSFIVGKKYEAFFLEHFLAHKV